MLPLQQPSTRMTCQRPQVEPIWLTTLGFNKNTLYFVSIELTNKIGATLAGALILPGELCCQETPHNFYAVDR
jgi:hypothetical protein